ncbi:MAG: TerB family tellurite resistance protein [Candidatus Ornithospirochaeta sp.]|nr:TerB family tellurite resistance protein [Candidatus Ornithospirochaeta sp.]
MKDFNKLCKAFEEIDPVSYSMILAEKSVSILPQLMAFSEDDLTGAEIFASFIIGAAAADGRLSEEEYALLYPLLRSFLGDSIDYEYVAAAFKGLRSEQKELKASINQMVDMLGTLSDELKEDIIIVIMLICAVDGKISFREKNWIRQLIR